MRRFMGVAFAAFGWSPSDFWSATPHELHAGLEVRLEMSKPK